MKRDSIKLILSTFTALTGVGGSYWKMEDRVSKLEKEMAKQEAVKIAQLEITQMKRDEELAELEHKIKLDSLRRVHDIR